MNGGPILTRAGEKGFGIRNPSQLRVCQKLFGWMWKGTMGWPVF